MKKKPSSKFMSPSIRTIAPPAKLAPVLTEFERRQMKVLTANASKASIQLIDTPAFIPEENSRLGLYTTKNAIDTYTKH